MWIYMECATQYCITEGGCPKCNTPNINRNTAHLKEEIFELTGNEYSVLGEYESSLTPIKMKHNLCGYVWSVRLPNFLTGSRCPNCFGNPRKTTSEFKLDIFNLVGSEYDVVGEYVNNKTDIQMIHNICNHKYFVQPNNFLSGSRCPQCAESKGEQVIRKYLDDKKMEFLQEYSFDSLVGIGGNPLRFDFAIFDKNNSLKFLVEYDGEFHYNKIYEDQNFEEMQIHDKRKNQYCKDNNIPLLRIPYWEFDNIEKILEEQLELPSRQITE